MPMSSSSSNSVNKRGILRCRSERSSPSCKLQCTKKNVRFSDCLDLEQAEYAISLRTDHPSAYNDDNDRACLTTTCVPYEPSLELQLQKCFWLPNEEELRWLTADQCLHLESVRWFGRAITGVVRVRNLGFEKKVEIIYTHDEWSSTCKSFGAYIGSPSSEEDRFSFCIFLPYLRDEMCVYICIRYECQGAVYWDSNGGSNYKFMCRTIRDGANAKSRNPFFDIDCSIFF